MKKGKSLLILLLAVLTMAVAFSMTSFAAGFSNEASYSEDLLGYAKLTAADAVYDGSAHGAVLEDNIRGSKPSDYNYQEFITLRAPYGTVSDITYFESDESQNEVSKLNSAPTDAGYYLALVTVTVHKYITEGENAPYWFDEEHTLTVFYQIKKAEVDVVWDDEKLVYDGTPQYPSATAGVQGGNVVELKVEPASSNDTCIDAGPHKAKAVMPEDSEASKNYTLKGTGAVKNYTIDPLPVELTWYRPAYDEYGVEDGRLQKVDEDTMIKLVYNGQEQYPTAEISNVVKNKTTDDTDKVRVIVEGGGTEANTYSSRPYLAKAADLEGSRSSNYSIKTASRRFQILPRPVELEWGYTPSEDADPVYVKNVDSSSRSYDYETVYNGLRQTPFAEVANPGRDNHNAADEVTIGEPTLVSSLRVDEHPVESDRIYTDAGTYVLQPGELSDSTNYTYYIFGINLDTGDIYLRDGSDGSAKYVDDYDAVYTIDQYVVENLVWDEKSLTKVYNACYQEPSVGLSKDDLQGPDKNEQCMVIPMQEEAEEENYPVNVGQYHFIATTELMHSGDIDRSMNYHISRRTTNGRHAVMTIVPAQLTVTANDKSITYGMEPADNGVRYSGLKNGSPNKDVMFYKLTKEEWMKIADEMLENCEISEQDYEKFVELIDNIIGIGIPYNTDEKNSLPVKGVFVKAAADEGAEDVEAREAIAIRHTYAKNGKPGSYAIVPYLKDGYSTPNYKINFVNGTLKVNDKVSVLVAKGTKKGSRGIKLSWNSVTGAAKYDVYMSKCNAKGKVYTPKFVKTVSGSSLNVKKLNGKKLSKNTCYKYYVVAKDASGKVLAKSKMGHFITGNIKGNMVNAKSMKTNTSSIAIAKGGTYKVSASYEKTKSSKKYVLINNAHHPMTRFVSENPQVATIDANGIVKGVSTGWCRIYVQGVSGMWKVVKVSVK